MNRKSANSGVGLPGGRSKTSMQASQAGRHQDFAPAVVDGLGDGILRPIKALSGQRTRLPKAIRRASRTSACTPEADRRESGPRALPTYLPIFVVPSDDTRIASVAPLSSRRTRRPQAFQEVSKRQRTLQWLDRSGVSHLFIEQVYPVVPSGDNSIATREPISDRRPHLPQAFRGA